MPVERGHFGTRIVDSLARYVARDSLRQLSEGSIERDSCHDVIACEYCTA